MPSGQALVSLLQSSGAVTLIANTPPRFRVNFPALRAMVKGEKATVLAAGIALVRPLLTAGLPVTGGPRFTQRTDVGTLSFTPPGGRQPFTMNVVIQIGCDGTGTAGSPPGLPRAGESVTLDARHKVRSILIAIGGDGSLDTSGGAASVIFDDEENLIIALGGDGFNASLAGHDGTDAGSAHCTGTGINNEIYAEGGVGGNGLAGAAGAPGTAGVRGVQPAMSYPGQKGGHGGAGGKAIISGGDSSYGLAVGGSGGKGAAGGAGGAAAPAARWNVLAIAAPAGAPGANADGGDGGNYRVALGANSITDPASKGGVSGASGGAPASNGAPGGLE